MKGGIHRQSRTLFGWSYDCRLTAVVSTSCFDKADDRHRPHLGNAMFTVNNFVHRRSKFVLYMLNSRKFEINRSQKIILYKPKV